MRSDRSRMYAEVSHQYILPSSVAQYLSDSLPCTHALSLCHHTMKRKQTTDQDEDLVVPFFRFIFKFTFLYHHYNITPSRGVSMVPQPSFREFFSS